ncbi:hypothetical protein AKJ16_DCAP19191 [Drosera capensis]
MSVGFEYWDDCVDAEDIEALWTDPEVSTEWLDAGEVKGENIRLSRDPDGQPYLTQIEMRDMICAIAELESDRQLLATRYIKKTKETTLGLLQILPKTADWLFRERSEEFVVRAFKGGTKKAINKSTLPYWKRYLSVKESLPSSKCLGDGPSADHASSSAPTTKSTGIESQSDNAVEYWDLRTSMEDMHDMWNNREVHREWIKSGQKRGQVRFSHDENKRLYLSRVELKAVAGIILSKHFSTRAVRPTVLCAIAEIISKRFVDGIGSGVGLMGIDYPTADWLYKELGYKAYKVESAEDLKRPFVTMYFGAAYMAWLSEYEGRERSPKFVVQAYLLGPKNVGLNEAGPAWLKFEEELSNYEGIGREQGSCEMHVSSDRDIQGVFK